MSENESAKAAQATPNATLEQQIMSACIGKNEREWWAKRKIDALTQELAQVKAERDSIAQKHEALTKESFLIRQQRDHWQAEAGYQESV